MSAWTDELRLAPIPVQNKENVSFFLNSCSKSLVGAIHFDVYLTTSTRHVKGKGNRLIC